MPFIIGYNLLQQTAGLTLTASSNDNTYQITNALNFRNLLRQYRSLTSSSDVSIVGTWGSQKTIKAIMLNDVNFSSVRIQGNNSDSWSSPPFNQLFSIANDSRVNRRKIYAVLTNFNYSFFRVLIPAQTPTDGLTVFRIGTIIPVLTELVFPQNPDYNYSWRVSVPEPRILTFPSGQAERNSRGNLAKLRFSFSFDVFNKSNEDFLYSIANIDLADFLVLYENMNDTSKCCLCYRNNDLDVSWKLPEYVGISRLEFEEAV